MNDPLGLIHPWDPRGTKVGGIETFLADLIRHLPARFDLEIVGIASGKKPPPLHRWQEFELHGRPVRFLPVLAVADENRQGCLPLSLRFSGALLCHPPVLDSRVVMFHRLEPALALRKGDRRWLTVVHNDIDRQLSRSGGEVRWRHAPGLYTRLERHLLRRMDTVFSVSSATLDRYRQRFPETTEKLALLPGWFDDQVFHPATRPRSELKDELVRQGLAVPADQPWVLFAGRFRAQKAPLRAIRAFAQVRLRLGRGHLLLIGEGELCDEIRQEIARLGFGQETTLLPAMPPQKLAEWYRAADVFLLSSLYEGAPRTVLEALGSGLPVVATPAGEVPRMVGPGAGRVTAGMEEGELAEALARVLQNPAETPPERCLAAAAPFAIGRVLPLLTAEIERLGSRD